MRKRIFFLLCSCVLSFYAGWAQHDIYFCGERIPADKEFVADKLMDVIRKQVPLVNLPSLRKRAELYFPIVENSLRTFGLPQDLKYLPIVESAFVGTARSRVGAHGFWQIMPKTAEYYGLVMNPSTDEREDINKASEVGCKLLRDNYSYLKKNYQVASWSLAAAAYNTGIGNMVKAVKKQGNDYFAMQLNPETAVYVYKIIAVKELFEYPELYMKSFGYNIFTSNSSKKIKPGGDENDDDFKKLQLQVSINAKNPFVEKTKPPRYISAHIEGKYKKIKDGDLVKIVLDEDLGTNAGVSRKGYNFSVQGWIIDGRVYFDLGYGHDLTLCDTDLKKGVTLNELKKNKKLNILLRNTGYTD